MEWLVRHLNWYPPRMVAVVVVVAEDGPVAIARLIPLETNVWNRRMMLVPIDLILDLHDSVIDQFVLDEFENYLVDDVIVVVVVSSCCCGWRWWWGYKCHRLNNEKADVFSKYG